MNTTNPSVTKKEIFGWAMFDFANSSYTTVVITVIYSAFFVNYIVPHDSVIKDSYWSIAIIIPTILAIFLSPFIWVICDCSWRKKRYLFFTVLLCSLATIWLFFVWPGDLFLWIFLLTIWNLWFMLSETFCWSFLTDLANKDNMALISWIGWGIGYAWWLVSLIATMFIITTTADQNLSQFIFQNQLTMVMIGIFFIITALPTFTLVHERSKPAKWFEDINSKKLIKTGIKELLEWTKILRNNWVLYQFLIAFTVYMAWVDAIIKFNSANKCHDLSSLILIHWMIYLS